MYTHALVETITIFLPSFHLKHRDHYLWPEKGDGKASYGLLGTFHCAVQGYSCSLNCSCTQACPK